MKEQVDINIKYDGYIKRQMRQVEQFKKLENKRIPENIDYDSIQSLRLEAKQKLNQIRPASIGQASRISEYHRQISQSFLYILEVNKK